MYCNDQTMMEWMGRLQKTNQIEIEIEIETERSLQSCKF